MEVKIVYNKNNVSITFNLTKGTLMDDVSNVDVIRYLKGIFTNKHRFKARFLDEFLRPYEETKAEHGEEFKCDDKLKEFLEIYDEVEPFSYLEAFKLENKQFQAVVFGSINISEMIKEMGHTRIKTEGIKVKHKTYNYEGEFTGYSEYDNIYEVHEVNGEKIGLTEKLYALKCWCTSTNKEHWLWIEDAYKDSPLEAVASTFRIHENLIPHIKELKRQGDILLVEMKEEVEPTGNIVPLTAKQYFDLLTAQS